MLASVRPLKDKHNGLAFQSDSCLRLIVKGPVQVAEIHVELHGSGFRPDRAARVVDKFGRSFCSACVCKASRKSSSDETGSTPPRWPRRGLWNGASRGCGEG